MFFALHWIIFPLGVCFRVEEKGSWKAWILILCFLFVCLFCFLGKNSSSYGWVCGNEKGGTRRKSFDLLEDHCGGSWSTQTWLRERAEEAGLGVGGGSASMGRGATLTWVSYLCLHSLTSVTLGKFFILRLRIFICKVKLMSEVMGLLRRFSEMVYHSLPQSDDHTGVNFITQPQWTQLKSLVMQGFLQLNWSSLWSRMVSNALLGQSILNR